MNVYACHMLPEHPPIHLGVEKPYCSLRSFSTVIPPGVIMHNMHKAMYIPVSPRREVPRYVHVANARQPVMVMQAGAHHSQTLIAHTSTAIPYI